MTNTLNVGDLVPTHEQFDELPVGTIVYFGTSPNLRYRKDGYLWQRLNADGLPIEELASTSFSLNMNRVESLPHPNVGQPITSQAQIDTLPVG